MNAVADYMAYQAPLFKTARGALLFAYNFVHGTLKKPGLVALMGGGSTGRGLGGLDGAAQAGMIKSEVEQLTPVRRRILECRFAPPAKPCPCKRACCSGEIVNPEWAESMGWLTEHVLKQALCGTISNFRLRRAILCRYFGQELSMTTVAAQCGVKRDTAAEHNRKVVTYLGSEEKGADGDIYGKLFEAGIIEA